MSPLESIESKRRELLDEQERIAREIAALDEALKILKPIYAELPKVEYVPGAGITDAVRSVFRMNPEHVMSPTEVRDMMAHFGFDLSGRKNALANIHQVIRRLSEAGEIEHIQSAVKPGFRWVGPGIPASLG